MRAAIAIRFACAVLALALFSAASADVPEIMSYQGVLRDDSGDPVPDGTYEVTFRLYDVEIGGTALWEESQSVYVEDAIFNVHLGEVVPLSGLDFLVPYWLGIDVESSGELAPRSALTTVPYAAHAGFADTSLEGDDDWIMDGDDIYRDSGNVGVGAAPVEARLDVTAGGTIAGDFQNGAVDGMFTVRASNVGGSAGGFFANCSPVAYPNPPAGVYAYGHSGAWGGFFLASTGVGLRAVSETGDSAFDAVHVGGGGYSARFQGGTGISVDGEVGMDAFRMPTGAASGYVLTSDLNGVGTWQVAPSGGSDSDWTVTAGDDMYAAPSGNVGIGDDTPDAKLDVTYDGYNEALIVEHSGTTTRAVNIERLSLPSTGNDMLQIAAPAGATDDFQYIECEKGGSADFYVLGSGRVVSSGGAYFADGVEIDSGQLVGSFYGDRVAEFTTDYAYDNIHVLHAECTGVSTGFHPCAVYGKSVPDDNYGYGGFFKGGFRGVMGQVTPSGTGAHRAVYGEANGGTGVNYGVYGYAGGDGNNYGVYGHVPSGDTGYAGCFSGDVYVSGTLSAGSKLFRVDHPLDPANMYLQHACVESDEMTNIYTGNAVLDGRGRAVVQLPEWFESVNSDFRYQLTCIGGYAPVYVAEGVSDGSFSIAGGEPGMKVSWQITAVRSDPYALAHPLEVAPVKPARDAGKYMHPELYGMPETAAIGYHEPEPYIEAQQARGSRPAPVHDPSDGAE